MPNLPWLEYAGQSTAALIAAKETHRIDSILCAFEQAVQRKLELEQALSEEEMLILAVEALEREVNNGGYHQFFVNSPQFAGSIADFLQYRLRARRCDYEEGSGAPCAGRPLGGCGAQCCAS